MPTTKNMYNWHKRQYRGDDTHIKPQSELVAISCLKVLREGQLREGQLLCISFELFPISTGWDHNAIICARINICIRV